MKTTFFIATAIFISSIATAQQANVRSTTASRTTVAGSPSGATAGSSVQNTTEVKGEAGGSGHNTTIMAVSSGKDNKSSAGTSIKASNNAGASVSASEANDIKKSSHSTVNQSVETSGDVAAHGRHSVRAQSESTVSASQSATKKAQAKSKRSARVNADTDASVNGQIRPVPFKASSMISSRAGLGL